MGSDRYTTEHSQNSYFRSPPREWEGEPDPGSQIQGTNTENHWIRRTRNSSDSVTEIAGENRKSYLSNRKWSVHRLHWRWFLGPGVWTRPPVTPHPVSVSGCPGFVWDSNHSPFPPEPSRGSRAPPHQNTSPSSGFPFYKQEIKCPDKILFFYLFSHRCIIFFLCSCSVLGHTGFNFVMASSYHEMNGEWQPYSWFTTILVITQSRNSLPVAGSLSYIFTQSLNKKSNTTDNRWIFFWWHF